MTVKETTVNIIVLIIALILLLLIMEMATRMVFGKNLQYSYTDDTLWELEPSQSGFSLPNGVIANINSAGFRGEEITTTAPAGYTRIAVLGGSVGFGWGVADNETFSAQLQNRLSDAEVMNLGEAGYGIHQMIAKYDKVGVPFNPDIVILLFSDTNVLAQPDLGKGTHWRSMLARKILRKSTLAAYLKPRLGFLRQWLTGRSGTGPGDFLSTWPDDIERILKFNEEMESEGKILVLMPYTFLPEQNLFYETVLEFGEEHEIIVTGHLNPLLEDYREENDPEDLVIEDGHPSALQFSIASELVAETLGELV